MDKKKQIEEMARDFGNAQYRCNKDSLCCKECILGGDCIPYEYARVAYNAGYRKIPENAVVLTEKEYKRYERIEKIIKLAKREKANGYEVKNGKLYYFTNMLNGFEYEFKDLQEICDAANHYNEEFWGLEQRLTFWQGKVEETRKETAEKFAEKLKAKLNEWLEDNEDLNGKIDFGIAMIELIGVKSLDGEVIAESLIDEICKEITEGKVKD